jgi:hypothetical protein
MMCGSHRSVRYDLMLQAALKKIRVLFFDPLLQDFIQLPMNAASEVPVKGTLNSDPCQ